MTTLSPRVLKIAIFFLLLAVLFQLITDNGKLSVTELLWRGKTVSNTNKLSYDVVIGVLSARNHFEERQALRDTWVGHIYQDAELSRKILVKFIVGDKACPIPPQDRIDQYSCEKTGLINPVLNEDIIAYKVPHGTSGDYVHSGPVGMDFKVNFPIIVKQLGVFDSESNGFKTELVVRLFDKVTETEVVNVTFNASSPGTLKGGSRFKPVDEYILPKGFEASIVAENFNEQDPCNNKPMEHGHTDSGGGLISFSTVSRFGMVQGMFPDNEESAPGEESNQYAAGTFIYHAYVSKEGEFSEEGQTKKEQEANLREKEWTTLVADEDVQLNDEMVEHNDILLVDEVEVYRNLPKKMMKFYTWVSNNVDFNFTLKTDDDCFVNIDSILKGLICYKLHSKSKVWWSGFRREWPLDKYGKWREPDYTASVYPAFGCGDGNMMSADLVRWLARNSNDLKPYQGEDVSLGIWLAAIGPLFVKDYKWACNLDCFRDMYTLPENNPDELRELWANLGLCGNPCGCS